MYLGVMLVEPSLKARLVLSYKDVTCEASTGRGFRWYLKFEYWYRWRLEIEITLGSSRYSRS